MSKYWEVKLHMVLVGLVLVGALNWGFDATGNNLVELLHVTLNKALNSNYRFNYYIYLTVAAAAVLLAIKKETWLPFLGKSVLPTELVPLSQPSKVDTKVKVHVAPNSKVVYWASQPSTKKSPHRHEAYGKYTNSGVVMSNASGVAELSLAAGTGYTLPSGIHTGRHVQYRVLRPGKVMMGKVHTKYY